MKKVILSFKILLGLLLSTIVFLSVLDLANSKSRQFSKVELNSNEKLNPVKSVTNEKKDLDEYIKLDNDDLLEVPIESISSPMDTGHDQFKPKFSITEIDDAIFNRIKGLSYQENEEILREDLRYLEVSYYNFDGIPNNGELLVNKAVAQDLIEIFKELYEVKYPIFQMRLVDEFDADDMQSMYNNNTSAFNFRNIAGSNNLSNHAYGLAIDINPIQNPYVYQLEVAPSGSEEFKDRSHAQQGMIIKNDVCYNAFVSRGWIWGGNWKSPQDYQHFEKPNAIKK